MEHALYQLIRLVADIHQREGGAIRMRCEWNNTLSNQWSHCIETIHSTRIAIRDTRLNLISDTMAYCSFMRAPTQSIDDYFRFATIQLDWTRPRIRNRFGIGFLCLILVHPSAVSIHHHLSAVESIAIRFRLETVLKRPQCCQHRLVCRIKVLDRRDQIMLHRKGIRVQHMVASRSVLVAGIMASYLDFVDTRRFVRIEIADVRSVSSSMNDNVSWLLRYVSCLIYLLL